MSNTLTPELKVVRDDRREPMTLSFPQDGRPGGENGEIEAGRWENFRINLRNDGPIVSKPWENVLIRVKFLGVDDENVSVGYMERGAWRMGEVHDVRVLDQGVIGGFADLGPSSGWRIEPRTAENLKLRMKVEGATGGLTLKIRAITRDNAEAHLGETGGPSSATVLEPLADTHGYDGRSLDRNISRDHLELSTGENSNSYILMRFAAGDLPREIGGAKLNLYQYWGSGFLTLRDSNVTVQVFPVSENLLGRGSGDISPEIQGGPIAEGEIKGNNEWYHFDISDYIGGLGGDDRRGSFSLLVRFSEEDFDDESRRIRFYSREGEKPPYIVVGE